MLTFEFTKEERMQNIWNINTLEREDYDNRFNPDVVWSYDFMGTPEAVDRLTPNLLLVTFEHGMALIMYTPDSVATQATVSEDMWNNNPMCLEAMYDFLLNEFKEYEATMSMEDPYNKPLMSYWNTNTGEQEDELNKWHDEVIWIPTYFGKLLNINRTTDPIFIEFMFGVALIAEACTGDMICSWISKEVYDKHPALSIEHMREEITCRLLEIGNEMGPCL